MDHDANNVDYARTQLSEARRRLDSVRSRITETEENSLNLAVDAEENTIITPSEIEETPEEDVEFRSIRSQKDKVQDIEGHIQNIIIDCQMCIELSVKSMFKGVDQEFDYSHGVGFESHNTEGFSSKVPADYPRKEEIIRAIFLTQVWEKHYEIAKYGVPEFDVGPSVVFEIEDGERAINDASFCVELAEDFIEYIDE